MLIADENKPWKVNHPTVPQQKSPFDCGIFVCSYMKAFVHNIDPCYDQPFNIYFRQYMARELMSRQCFPRPMGVTGPPSPPK